jgi:hypothetical protein
LGRLSQPEDIAASIAFLASSEARMINGAVLCATAGRWRDRATTKDERRKTEDDRHPARSGAAATLWSFVPSSFVNLRMLITKLVTVHAAARGAHPFIRHDGRAVSFCEFERLTNQAAHAFAALGVTKGDRVTLGMGNSVEISWPLSACSRPARSCTPSTRRSARASPVTSSATPTRG